jgi:hypothetical protein
MNTNCDFVTGLDGVVIQPPPVITKRRGLRILRAQRMPSIRRAPGVGRGVGCSCRIEQRNVVLTHYRGWGHLRPLSTHSEQAATSAITAPPTAVMAAISCIGIRSPSPKGAAYRHDPDVDWQFADSIKFSFSGKPGSARGMRRGVKRFRTFGPRTEAFPAHRRPPAPSGHVPSICGKVMIRNTRQ